MEETTFETHPFSFSSSISNESNEVKDMNGMEESFSLGRFNSEPMIEMEESIAFGRFNSEPMIGMEESISFGRFNSEDINGMEESVSFGRFASESLNWEKFSTFSRNHYVEEAEKYSRPGSVMQKKFLLEAHFKKMTSLKDEPCTTPSPDHLPDVSISIQQPHSEQLIMSTEPTIHDEQWIDKEDFGDKSSNGAVVLDQLTDVNPVAETANDQESGSQRSSVNKENSAPESAKRTPLSSFIPSVEGGSARVSSSTQADSPAAAAQPVNEMGKKRSTLYKFMNAKLIKKITLSSKASNMKTSRKEKPKRRLFDFLLCGSNPPSKLESEPS